MIDVREHASDAAMPSERSVMLAVDGGTLSHRPYRHLIADDLFSDTAFSRIAAHVRTIGESGSASFSREPDYGARIFGLSRENLGPLSDLINLAIIQRIAARLDVPVTPYVDAAVHFHPPGSPSGWLHTDFNIGWFARRSGSGPHFSDRDICDYRSGRSMTPGETVELTRSIAMILYFSDRWDSRHGGETVICRSAVDAVDDAHIRVAPLANRLLAFECSPVSFHSFATTEHERMSVIFWAHADAAQLANRWPLSLRSGWR